MFISVPCLYLRVSRCRNNKKTSYFRLLVLLSFVTTGMWGTIMICTAMIYTRWSAKHATQRNCNKIIIIRAPTTKFHCNKPTPFRLHMAKFQQNINIFLEVIAHILTYPPPWLMHFTTLHSGKVLKFWVLLNFARNFFNVIFLEHAGRYFTYLQNWCLNGWILFTQRSFEIGTKMGTHVPDGSQIRVSSTSQYRLPHSFLPSIFSRPIMSSQLLRSRSRSRSGFGNLDRGKD